MKDPTIKQLAEEVAELKHELGVLQDIQAIKTVQFAYGYYLDKCLYDEVVDTFANDCEARFGGGRFIGKAGIKRLFLKRFRKRFTGGYNGPIYGFLLDHQMLQDIISVAPDRKTARARMRVFMQAGTHYTAGMAEQGRMQQWWEAGIYENEYVREKGVWKIKVLNYNVVFFGTFEEGWAAWKNYDVGCINTTYPDDPTGADELFSRPPGRWPETPVIPFHYLHPVTGKPWKPAPKPKGKK
jgi:hypothetical protein